MLWLVGVNERKEDVRHIDLLRTLTGELSDANFSDPRFMTNVTDRWNQAIDILVEDNDKDFKVYQDQFLLVLGFCLIFLLAGTCVMFFVARAVTRPLKAINEQMQALASLSLDEVHISADEDDPSSKSSETRSRSRLCGGCLVASILNRRNCIREVNEMNDAFVCMANGLKSFSRYMDPSLVEILVKSRLPAVPNVRKAEVTVFFSDIAGFSSMAEKLAQDPFMALLAQYLDAMSEIIMDHRGIIGEFIGDAIMAWWNAPLHLGNRHTELALAAALKQQTRLAELREEWKLRGFPEVRARMGLVRGQVMAGNIGSKKRMKYGLVGDCVNLASRLEGLCKHYGVSILVDEEVCCAPGVKDRFLLRHLDTVTVVGRKTRTQLYEVVGFRKQFLTVLHTGGHRTEFPGEAATEERLAFCEDFHSIQESFRARAVHSALQALDAYQARWPEDKPAALLRQRCEQALEQGLEHVQADWSPTVKFNHK